MKLRYTPIQGYVHTAEAVVAHAGLGPRIEPVATRPFDADTDLGTQNPLGTVPTLILDDGTPLYGGPVIYEYLDTLSGEPPLYPAGPELWRVKRQVWLADGMFDAMVRLIIEGWETGEKRPPFIARQWGKVLRGLDTLEREAADWGPLDMGQMRAVGAISFIALKMRPVGEACPGLDAGFDWRHGRPGLSGWYDRVASLPALRTNLVPQG